MQISYFCLVCLMYILHSKMETLFTIHPFNVWLQDFLFMYVKINFKTLSSWASESKQNNENKLWSISKFLTTMTLGETKSFVCSNISLQLYSVTKEELLELKIVSKKNNPWVLLQFKTYNHTTRKLMRQMKNKNYAITRKLMKQMKKKTLLCALKLLFEAERKLNCHIFTSNKANCSRDEYFFYKNTHVVNRVTIKTLWKRFDNRIAHWLQDLALLPIFTVYKSNSIHQLKFVYMYIRKLAKQIPSSL